MAASMHREVERKYDVDASAILPPFDSLEAVAMVEGPVEHDLEAVYFDTADLALARGRVTLRRRTGGDDAGWHLKLPVGGDGRQEIRLSLGRGKTTVPKQLRTIVRGLARDQQLQPVATLRTHRVVHRLVDDTGDLLAEIADDTVTAEVPAPDQSAETSSWREWEAELASGSPDLLDAVDELIADAGASPAEGPSKLVRALGGRLAQSEADDVAPPPEGSAAAVIQDGLRRLVANVATRDPQVRADLPDGVHKMRVGIRRLRSALATFRPFFDRGVTDPIRDELKWLADALGHARDAEVMRKRLLAQVGEEPTELVMGPVKRQIDARFSERYRAGLEGSYEAMGSDRYFALLDVLDSVVAAPPWTDRAGAKAEEVLPARVRHDWKRVRRSARAFDGASDDAERASRLHEVRKAAKRARYAAELLVPVSGADAKKFGKAMKRVQSVLGDHHDSVVAQGELRQLGVKAHLDGDNGFSFGRLHAIEQTEAADKERQYGETWERSSRKKLRRWMP